MKIERSGPNPSFLPEYFLETLTKNLKGNDYSIKWVGKLCKTLNGNLYIEQHKKLRPHEMFPTTLRINNKLVDCADRYLIRKDNKFYVSDCFSNAGLFSHNDWVEMPQTEPYIDDGATPVTIDFSYSFYKMDSLLQKIGKVKEEPKKEPDLEIYYYEANYLTYTPMEFLSTDEIYTSDSSIEVTLKDENNNDDLFKKILECVRELF